MAVEYFNISPIQRSAGKSIVAKAAYDSCSVLKDETINKTFDYNNKNGLVYSQIIFPKNMEVLNRQDLWNKVEREETRKNSCLGRAMTLSLPKELSQNQRRELSIEISKKISERYDCPADFSIHEPVADWKKKNGSEDEEYENPHVHILIPDRNKDGDKIRVLSTGKKQDENGKTETDHLRILLSESVRKHLDNAGLKYVSYTLEKKPELKERILLHEKYTKELDAEIANTRKAIAELERRIQEDGRKDSRSTRIQDAGNYERRNGEVQIHGQHGINDRKQVLRHNTNAQPNRLDSKSSARNDVANTRDDSRESRAEQNNNRPGRKSREARKHNCKHAAKLAENLSLLKYKLEQLKEERLAEDIRYAKETIRSTQKERTGFKIEEESSSCRSRKTEIKHSFSEAQSPK